MGGLARLEGRVALVTGGTRGIGAAVSRALAGAGARVYAVYRRDAAAAGRLEAELGGAVATIQADVSDPAAASSVVTHTLTGAGRLDVLVNCAGGSSDRLLLRATSGYVTETLASNLVSAIHTTRAALQPMLKNRYGRVVSIGSVVATAGNPGQSVYAAAKAGIEGFTRSLAREVAAKGVTVNCIAPGWIDSELTARAGDLAREKVIAATPVGRAGTPEDVANAVLFLTSESTSFVTGTVLHVNGGLYM